jgi:DNA-directed RNA polymerase specialized sigma24 family protein
MSTPPYQTMMSRSSFEQSLANSFPVVFRRLTTRFGDEQLAEEVSLDCLSQAFELWRLDPAYFATHDLTAWASRRATWRALDRLRERARHRPLPEERSDDDRAVAAVLPLREAAAEQVTRDRELTWQALQKLAPEDRAVLVAWYYDQLSDQEIGAALYGAGNGTAQARGLRVWRRRQRARARLRDLVIAEGVDAADWGGLAV